MANIEVIPDHWIDRTIEHSTTTSSEVEEDVFVFPASPAQERFWNLNSRQPETVRNIAVRFHLRGPLQSLVLEKAVREIVQRHESLRTTFAVLDGSLVQIVSQRVQTHLRYDYLSTLPERERLEWAQVRAHQEASSGFDLKRGPLFRAILLELDDDEHILVITAHPCVFDAWSVRIVTRELEALYRAYCQGMQSPLPELKLQYGDFTVWQKQRMRGSALEEQKAYWLRQLANLPDMELPTDRPRLGRSTFGTNSVSFALNPALTNGLEILCKRSGMTSFTLLLAAFNLLLLRFTGKTDVVVGSVLTGRRDVDLELSIGPYNNPVVLRTDLSGDPSFDELALRVRDTVLEAVAKQDMPFEKIVEPIQEQGGLVGNPIVKVNFEYVRDLVQEFNAAGVSFAVMPPLSTGAIYDLSVVVAEGSGGSTVSCEFDTDVLDKATVSRLLAQYQKLLQEITCDSTLHLSEYFLEAAAANDITDETTELQSSAPCQDQIQKRLVDIWKALLKIEQIHVSDDFFDLGGDSLLATQMIVDVQEEYGQKISPGTFLRSPTIESLTALLLRGLSSSPFEQDRPIRHIPFNRGRPTLFLVHDGDGDSLLYLNLARCLRDEVEVYCLEPLGSTRCPCLHTRIPEMASYYIEQMQLTHPKGPYFLGGLCAGGVIAFEMATQLRASGEEIGIVALFDAVAPRAQQRAGIIAQQRRGRFLQTLRDTANLTAWQRWKRRMTIVGQKLCNLFVYEVRTRLERFISWIRFLAFQSALDRDRPVPQWAEGLPVRLIYDMAEQSYVPGGKFDVPVVLMRATTGEGDDEPLVNQYVDAMLGWPAYVTGKVDVVDVPGGHSSMLKDPHVAVLAELLRAGIQRRLDR